MRQLIYTSCRPGMSVNGRSGFQVRAASPGADHLKSVVAICAYSLPPGTVPDERTASVAPVRLALLEVEGEGRVLCHSVYAGREPAPGPQRFGNFLTHVLLDLPDSISALDCVKTWGSPDWRRTDDGGPILLPETSLPAEGKLGQEPLASLLARDGALDVLRLVLIEYLRAPPDEQIVLRAEPDLLAALVLALCRWLPSTLTARLTFSTFESSPSSCRARLVGTLDALENTTIPALAEPRQSAAAPIAGPWVELIMRACRGDAASAEHALLVRNWADRARIASELDLDALARVLVEDQGAAAADLVRLSRHPSVAPCILEQPAQKERIGHLIVHDPEIRPALLAWLRLAGEDGWALALSTVDPRSVDLRQRLYVLTQTERLPIKARESWASLEGSELAEALRLQVPPADAVWAFVRASGNGAITSDALFEFAARADLSEAALRTSQLSAEQALRLVRAMRGARLKSRAPRLINDPAALAGQATECWLALTELTRVEEAAPLVAAGALDLLDVAPPEVLAKIAPAWMDAGPFLRRNARYRRFVTRHARSQSLPNGDATPQDASRTIAGRLWNSILRAWSWLWGAS